MPEPSDNTKDSVSTKINEYLDELSKNHQKERAELTKLACENKKLFIGALYHRLVKDKTYELKTPITEVDIDEALSCQPPQILPTKKPLRNIGTNNLCC